MRRSNPQLFCLVAVVVMGLWACGLWFLFLGGAVWLRAVGFLLALPAPFGVARGYIGFVAGESREADMLERLESQANDKLREVDPVFAAELGVPPPEPHLYVCLGCGTEIQARRAPDKEDNPPSCSCGGDVRLREDIKSPPALKWY